MPEVTPENEPESRRSSDDLVANRIVSHTSKAIRKWLKSTSPSSVRSGSNWILAISGGPDSVALLKALKTCFPDEPLILAHMNHHSRVGSDADEEFVRQLAKTHSLTLEIGHWQASRTSHFEADARKARHEWLCTIALQHNASAILTAHTLDDQAETLLMRIARGTGPTGMAGIRPWRRLKGTQTDLVRPFLKVSKSEIMDFLNLSNTPFCIDPTNTDTDHQTRAWVRQSLIPSLKDRLNPCSVQALGRLADLVREEQDQLGLIIHDNYKKCAKPDLVNLNCDIHPSRFRTAGSAWLRRQILRKIWSEMGWPMREMSLQHWVRLSRWVSSRSILHGSILHLPGHIQATRTDSRIRIEHHQNRLQVTLEESVNDNLPIPFDCPGEVIADDLKIQASPLSTIPTIPEIVALDPSEYAAIDPEKLVGPIFLRHPQNGDRFDPLGLRGRHQKLVDFLRIQGVSHHDKKKIWIMCDQIGVIWVVGHRISDRVKITSASRSALLISARRIGSDY